MHLIKTRDLCDIPEFQIVFRKKSKLELKYSSNLIV